jgi:hypothetical protein
MGRANEISESRSGYNWSLKVTGAAICFNCTFEIPLIFPSQPVLFWIHLFWSTKKTSRRMTTVEAMYVVNCLMFYI